MVPPTLLVYYFRGGQQQIDCATVARVLMCWRSYHDCYKKRSDESHNDDKCGQPPLGVEHVFYLPHGANQEARATHIGSSTQHIS